MSVQRTRRAAVAALLSLALATGVAAPAFGAPADEARNLAKLKKQWTTLTTANKKAICKGYKSSPDQLTTLTVMQVWGQPVNRQGMTQDAWRTVLGRYFTWACSGPGTTPRR